MSTTDLAQQVADLTTATTKLTEEVVGQKDRLTAAADTATSKASESSGSASAAAQSASDASASAVEASNQADRASDEADRASQVSGLDTVEEAVDMALSEYAGVMSTSEHDAILAQNEEKYAASGMVHMGKHAVVNASGVINEGLWAGSSTSEYANQLFIGRNNSDQNGTSKTDTAVAHIAGVVSNLSDINPKIQNASVFDTTLILPPAPPGYDVYDSTGDVRGTGKANLNLLTEIDPKYGDIAATQNEAVARAFEGNIINGDIRNGTDGWRESNGGIVSESNGQLTVSNNNQAFGGAINDLSGAVVGTEYIVKFDVVSVTGSMLYLLRNGMSITQTIGLSNIGDTIETRVTATGSFPRLQFEPNNSTANNSITVSNISVKPVTEEVVTDRVDMFGLEQFDMVMKDDEIFDMVQSQSTTFGDTGVPTVDSIRPDSFFAAYDGQTGITKGKCVKWSTLTDVQKRKVAGYMKERLWVNEDGDLTFTTIRQRSFAGAGNGDWENVNSEEDVLRSGAPVVTRPAVQGVLDAPSIDTTGARGFFNNGSSYAKKQETGVFHSISTYDNCFFYVLGTCSRLNSGAYHPSLNPYGTDGFISPTGSTTVSWFAKKLNEPTTTTHCFIGREDYPATSGYKYNYGSIASAVHAQHPDGRLYDAIYADGLGGVVDLRLSAYDMSSPEESAKVWEKVKNGTYRGLEKLVKSNIDITQVGYSSSFDRTWLYMSNTVGGTGIQTQLASVDKIHVYVDGVKYTDFGGTTPWMIYGGALYLTGDLTGSIDTSSTLFIFLEDGYESSIITGYSLSREDLVQPINTSVSGNFTMTDVIGDPANILQTDALKGGWQGSWIPVIPDGSGRLPLSRKSLVSSGTQTYTTDNGVSWGSAALPISTTTNDLSDAPAGMVLNITYTAFAKQTKPSTNKPVLNGEAGVGDVWAAMHSGNDAGVLLGESLIGKVFTNGDGGFNNIQTLNLTDWSIDYRYGYIYPNAAYRTQNHATLGMAAPSNNSPAVKALPYQISDNGQCSIGVQANELTYTDGSWNDDSTIKITTSVSDVFNDTAGVSNLSVAHELSLPIGWSKNRARVSTQTDGVDL